MREAGQAPPQQGDETALFERYGARLRRATALNVTTSPEIVDDACAFAWAQLLLHQPRRETVFPWLKAVARNEAFRLDGVARRVVALDPGAISGLAVDRASATGELLSDRWTPEAVHARIEATDRLAALPKRERTVTFLRAAGWRYDDLASHLGISDTRVNQLLARADARMREMDIREQEISAPRAARLRELEDEPPSYLVASIGMPPRSGPKVGQGDRAREWRRLALAIEDYRSATGVTDRVFPLGTDNTPSVAKESLQQRIAQFRRARGLSRGLER